MNQLYTANGMLSLLCVTTPLEFVKRGRKLPQ
jgi:hypothetical protein